MAFNERQFYHPNSLYKFKDNEVLLIIEQECKLFEKVLDDIKPDYVLMHPPNFHNDQIFSVMCKHRKIKTRMLGFSRFGRRSIITSEFDKFDDQTNEINENEKENLNLGNKNNIINNKNDDDENDRKFMK